MDKLKVMTIAGTRPELIRLSEIIKKADIYFEHIFVHTGQNYDARLNDIFYEDLGIRRPDHYLDAVGKNLGETMGNIIAKSYTQGALASLVDMAGVFCALLTAEPLFSQALGILTQLGGWG